MERTYRLMIVDDERIVREAISSHIPWEDYGVSMAKTAANALEALEYLKMHPVDMILVDIRMPVMDGLELLRRVKSQWPQIDFIILSGYADFAYAQEALRFGAKDYLLKPLDEDSLINVVLKSKNERNLQQFSNTLKKHSILEEAASMSTKASGSQPYSQTIKKIIKIVDEEIENEALSLKWISSQKLFLNENYLSKVFQKETGQKFSSYLLERRMLLAMQLLANDPDMQIQQVAALAGFGDGAQYFSSTFKKYTGYTPTEYKKYIKQLSEV